MQIERLDIENVMRFQRFTANFAPGFNVIIGENGAGKTTILQLLRYLVSQWTPDPASPLPTSAIRESIAWVDEVPVARQHRPSWIGFNGTGPDGAYFSSVEGDNGGALLGVAFNIHPRAARLLAAAEADVQTPLPLFAFFPPRRAPPRDGKPNIPILGPERRVDGYKGALDLDADFDEFAAWFKRFEMQRVESGKPFAIVESARRALIAVLPGCTDVRWFPVLNDILVINEDGESHPIWRLSDGYRTMLALVGELATRAAILNPALGGAVTEQVQGVVLIDEIDIHLHPSWQRRVVGDLRRVFPKVQFIATTHSPFVIQSMEAHAVINLDRSPSLDYQRSSVEDIAEVEMGVEGVARSAAFQEKVAAARDYLRALDEQPTDASSLARLKARLDEIQTRFGADPVYVASLLQKRAARGLG